MGGPGASRARPLGPSSASLGSLLSGSLVFLHDKDASSATLSLEPACSMHCCRQASPYLEQGPNKEGGTPRLSRGPLELRDLGDYRDWPTQWKNVYTNPSGGHQGRPNHQGTCEWFPVENRMAYQVRQGTRPEEVLEVLGGKGASFAGEMLKREIWVNRWAGLGTHQD